MDQVMDRVSHQPPHRGQQPEPVILEVTNTSRYVEEAVIEASHGDLESDQSDMGYHQLTLLSSSGKLPTTGSLLVKFTKVR